MKIIDFIRRGLATATAAGLLLLPVSGLTAQQDIQIQIQNNQTDGGFYLTPLWYGLHGGGFDQFETNDTTAATPGIELLAEEGDASVFMGEFTAAEPGGQQGVIISPGGFAGAPVIDPGETAMSTITVADPTANRYFSFASMVIPSNDAFIGNDDGMAYQLFDAVGMFNGPLTIQIFGSDVWDAGTEVNDAMGAAFSANGGMDSDEMLFVRAHPGLGNFVGSSTVAGTDITSDLGANELLATITITGVPEPGSLTVLGLASAFVVVRRRRRG